MRQVSLAAVVVATVGVAGLAVLPIQSFSRRSSDASSASAPFDVALEPPDFDKATGDNHLFMAAGVLRPGARESRSFVLPTLTRARVLLLGNDVSWSFRAPGGKVIVTGETAPYPGYDYAQAGDGLAVFTLDHP